MMYDILIQQMRDEVTRVGARELRTPEEVDTAIPALKGTTLVVVNSVCGCAAGIARPALAKAMHHPVRPDNVVTVFAGQDKEATARARSWFGNLPPSSPSFGLMREGKLLEMVHRHQIEGRPVDHVAQTLIEVFERHCSTSQQKSA